MQEEQNSVGISPKMDNSTSKSSIIYRLTPEVWLQIFAHLKCYNPNGEVKNFLSDNDLLKCFNTCQYFSNILAESKTEWLFPEILPIIFGRLSNSEVLRCRQVCKSWKRGVDHFLEYESEYFYMYMNQFSSTRSLLLGPRTHRSRILFSRGPFSENFYQWQAKVHRATASLSQEYNLTRFLQTAPNLQNFTPPGRTLTIFYRNNISELEDLKRLLNMCGHNVRILILESVSEEKLPGLNEYLSLIQLTPHIRRLNIRQYLNDSYTDNCENHSKVVVPCKLACLESIEFSKQITTIPLYIQKPFVSAFSNQLKVLEIGCWSELKNLWSLGFMPELEVLKITVRNLNQLNAILQDASWFPKLTSITVRICNLQRKVLKVYLGDILKILRKFSKSLDTLVVGILQESDLNKVKAMVRQDDLYILKEFSALKHICIDSFCLYKLKIVDCIPSSVKCLTLTRFVNYNHLPLLQRFRYRNKVQRRMTGNLVCTHQVSSDLPKYKYYRKNQKHFQQAVEKCLPNLEYLNDLYPGFHGFCLYEKV